MKYFKYQIMNRANVGTEKEPKWYESFITKRIPAIEANEEIAKAEAYKGEYTIEDDGTPEPEQIETTDDVLNALLGVE